MSFGDIFSAQPVFCKAKFLVPSVQIHQSYYFLVEIYDLSHISHYLFSWLQIRSREKIAIWWHCEGFIVQQQRRDHI